MPGVKHATKKRFAKASTRQKTIDQNISAEFTDNRNKLNGVYKSIKLLIKHIEATGQVWAAVGKQHVSFAEALVASLPAEGPVRVHAREVEETVRRLQRDMLTDVNETAPHMRVLAILRNYLEVVNAVQSEYPDVETTFTEVARYQRKVDKLAKKGAKKRESLDRNITKQQTAQREHETALTNILERMKSAYDKHEAVFQCAHHAFWLAQERYASAVNEATKNIRWESMALRDHLVNIDVANTPRILPLPRPRLLPPPPATVTSVSSAEGKISSQPVPAPQPFKTQPKPIFVTQPVVPEDDTHTASNPPSKSGNHRVVHLTPNAPTVSVTLPPSPGAKSKVPVSSTPTPSVASEKIMYIPAVPTELPQPPGAPSGAPSVTIEPTVIEPSSVDA